MTQVIAPFEQRGHMFTPGSGVPQWSVTKIGDRWFASVFDGVFSCTNCDAYPLVDYDGETITARTECGYPYGVPVIEFDLVVPSGEIVIRDDLRPVYDVDDTALRSLNSSVGQMDRSLASAANGFAYGFVMNTSPGLYRLDDDNYAIANGHWVEEDEGDDWIDPPGVEVASIVTDTWSYCVADAADWDVRLAAAQADPTIDEGRWWRGTKPQRVAVKPGIYRFTHRTAELGFDYHSDRDVTFATIVRRDL